MLNNNKTSFLHQVGSFNCKSTKTKSNENARIKILKQNLDFIKQQTNQNNEMNKKTRIVLNRLSSANSNNEYLVEKPKIVTKLSDKHYSNCKKQLTRSKLNLVDLKRQNDQISKINSDLINYVKLRERYMQHANYWQQIWLFTDNPIFEYENCIGFENPTYKYLNAKENHNRKEVGLIDQLDCSPIFDVAVMNIYESILDLNQPKPTSSLISSSTSIGINNNCELESISSPDSNDSGIHSDNHLNRHNLTASIMTNHHEKFDDFNSEKTNSINGEDSLYSSVISSKKSSDFFSREFSSCSKLDSADEDDSVLIKHVEQHELPLGWIRCCDENGIYYWHKPSGTVTRKPPSLTQTTTAPLLPEKKFNINAEKIVNSINKSSLTSSSASSTSSSSNQNRLNSDFDLNADGEYEPDEDNHNDHRTHLQIELDKKNSNNDSSSSSRSSYSSSIIKTNPTQDRSSLNEIKKEVKRFYVRSLGWVTIDENDLTPERSSKAVNKCINDLSKGHRDINDVVARWGEGQDLYMDLVDSYLILTDPKDNNVLNKLPITSVRVWGVGRDNGRDFAYVARDKQTKIHMCHVFRCDSAPAKEIANCMRDACRRIINEKKLTVDSNSSHLLKRPNFLPDISSKFNVKLKSLSCNDNSEFTFKQYDTDNENRRNLDFLSPTDEPKKSIKCRYLGNILVNRPSGMDVLNEAIEKIYMKALDDYKRVLKQKKSKNFNRCNNFMDDDQEDEENEEYDYDNMFSFNLLDLNGEKELGTHVDVSISPSTVSVKRIITNQTNNNSDENLILECRVRYLSFMGISIDARLCGFIMHCADNTFKCHAFLCENSSGQLCKTIEAACKLRYAKCLDAHPEAANENNSDSSKTSARFGFLGTQLKSMFDSFRTKNIFSNNSSSTSSNK